MYVLTGHRFKHGLPVSSMAPAKYIIRTTAITGSWQLIFGNRTGDQRN